MDTDFNQIKLDEISDLVEDRCFEQAEKELEDYLLRENLSPQQGRRAVTLLKLCVRTLVDCDERL